ncbi:WW domain-binding protein 4 [Sitophilus oryzae]|uniref:WW domain-binding protein 4 n=1 Tax=Sitophilus oryzae TaxID=7048 RepID=A0A6J2Y7L1_SITOR|nr:WW domain-binding protein 4 [Sitophilus oryzae]
MADYWKSQDRKYCDFCKCWIADNKPSRDFHENGRRHKENVKKRLNTISKNSAKEQRDSNKMDAAIKAMELAAMQAYQKDVQQNTAADLTSIAINQRLKDEQLEIASGVRKIWKELVAKDGKSYYWNTLTNETVWTAPPEGFLSVKEQREESLKETSKQVKEVESFRRKEALLRIQEQNHDDEERRAKLEREKLKARRVKEETPPPTYGPLLDEGKNDAYGKWQSVKEVAPLDLQLPEQPEYLDCPVVVEPEPVVKEFKEKVIESVGNDQGPSSFKKRKFSAGAKRNTRQRLDVD